MGPWVPSRTLAFANAADAVEVLAVGFMLTVYTNADGSQLTSGQKGEGWISAR
jgi:hypothetical protein